MSKMMNEFINITKMSQKALKKHLKKFANKIADYTVIDCDGFLLLVPDSDALNYYPCVLTAHMDTVHKETVRNVIIEKHENQTILTSPQGIGGDDRCGIFMIKQLIKKGHRPFVIFTEDEEIGCVGASIFAKMIEVMRNDTESNFNGYYPCMDAKFIVELDRRGSNDAVYYDLDNAEFEEFVTNTTGYTTEWGSCSDICEIAPALEIAAVNLSCGYYKEHTLEHFVVWEEMIRTMYATEKLLKASKDCKAFEWKEWQPLKNSYGKYLDTSMYTFKYIDVDGTIRSESYSGCSFQECVGCWTIDHSTLSWSNVIDVKSEWEELK